LLLLLFICVLGISNLHISTIFLLNAGTVPTVCYIFVHFIIGYEENPAELQLLKKNMVVIVFRNYNRQNEIQPN
jgi:ABC-type anion transport system duplicated permease subunit